MLFGLLYSSTVARFPKGIFVLAASILLISVILLSGVHPHQSINALKRKKGQRPWEGQDVERGRSRVSKDLNRMENYGATGNGNQPQVGEVVNDAHEQHPKAIAEEPAAASN
jgi:hypothetical protein